MGYWDVVALGVNGMIGAGIFFLPGVIAENLGSSALLAAAFAGFVASLNVMCFARIAPGYANTGGPYLYARDFLGRAVGFEIGWLNWCSRMLSWAAIAHGFAIALRTQFGTHAPSYVYAAGLIGLIVLLSALNLRGVALGARVSTVFTVAKLAPITLFIVVASFAFDIRRFSGILEFSPRAFGDATLVVFWAFLGFESVVVTAGETKNPKKMLWPAMITIITAVTVIYLLVIAMVFGTLDEVAGRENPVADASRMLMGETGGRLIAVGILVSVFGMASAHALVVPRCIFAMAEHHDLPHAVAWIHAIYRTPVVAILLSGVITLVFALSGSFKDLAVLSVLARFTQYITTAIAVLIMAVRDLRVRGMTSRSLGAMAVPLMALGTSIWVMAQANAMEWIKVGAAACLGLPFLAYSIKSERKLK